MTAARATERVKPLLAREMAERRGWRLRLKVDREGEKEKKKRGEQTGGQATPHEAWNGMALAAWVVEARSLCSAQHGG